VSFARSVIVAAVIACVLPAASSAEVPRMTVTIRVYQDASVPPEVEERSLVEAGTVLRTAFVDVTWQVCSRLNTSPACRVPLGSSELLLRVVRDGGPCLGSAAHLGRAVVVPAGRSVLATVYFGCVTRVARTTRSDVAVLLGRVIAHELGHLLIPATGHARQGLMRRHWTRSEVWQNRAADWAFTAEDVAAMRQPGQRP
jgi:hypothetical protein